MYALHNEEEWVEMENVVGQPWKCHRTLALLPLQMKVHTGKWQDDGENLDRRLRGAVSLFAFPMCVSKAMTRC